MEALPAAPGPVLRRPHTHPPTRADDAHAPRGPAAVAGDAALRNDLHVLAELWERMLEAEAELCLVMQRVCASARRCTDALVSRAAVKDASMSLWVIAAVAVAYMGWPLVWVMELNFLLGWGLCMCVRARTPSDVHTRVRRRPRLSPHGFPCVELQMGCALLVSLAVDAATSSLCPPVLLALTVCVCVCVCALRLAASTHFPHQLLLSVILGAASVPGLNAAGHALLPPRIAAATQSVLALLCASVYVCVWALDAEANPDTDVLLAISTEEVTRVLRRRAADAM